MPQGTPAVERALLQSFVPPDLQRLGCELGELPQRLLHMLHFEMSGVVLFAFPLLCDREVGKVAGVLEQFVIEATALSPRWRDQTAEQPAHRVDVLRFRGNEDENSERVRHRQVLRVRRRGAATEMHDRVDGTRTSRGTSPQWQRARVIAGSREATACDT